MYKALNLLIYHKDVENFTANAYVQDPINVNIYYEIYTVR